jgi:dienelactone hydrolase
MAAQWVGGAKSEIFGLGGGSHSPDFCPQAPGLRALPPIRAIIEEMMLTALFLLTIQGLLDKPVLDPNQPMVEVQVYTASRVPPLRAMSDAKQWQQQAERLRQRVLDEVVFRGEARRWRDAPQRVEWLDTIPAEGYRIRKLRFEAVPGLWVAALLYEPAKLSGKVPAVLNVNGHEKEGKSTAYIQERCINLAKRGILALNPEWIGRGQMSTPGLHHYRMNQLDLTGTSGLAVFFLSLRRSLDVLVAHANTDPERVAVTGLSGGSWQTIILSALDTRVRLANPVAGYSSYVTRAQWPDLDLGDSEQTPSDLATVVDYTHLTAMMAPRPTLLTHNAKDNCCFRADYAVGPLIYAAKPFFELFDAGGRLRYHLNHDPGHNYGQDNREAFYRMLRDFFYKGSSDFNASEIPVRQEVRTSEQLHVPLPQGNADFHSLATELMRQLPRSKGDRSRLHQLVRAQDLPVYATRAGEAKEDAVAASYWKLRMGEAWTVPAVEVAPAQAKSTVLLVADDGRSKAAMHVERLVKEGKRVVALDPFYFGESKIAKRDYLFAILIAALGERPLGLQASQVAAAARWLETERNLGPVSLVTVGPRSSLFGIIAAALEPESIAGVETHGAFASLKDVITGDLSGDKTPELFCFGLLQEFDIPQIEALIAPRAVKHN